VIPRVFRRLAAEFDLEEIAVLIGRHRPRTALRFLAAAEKKFQLLCRFPKLGAVHPAFPPSLRDIRFFPIKRFRTILVFYRPIVDGIEIVRVIHGARDVAPIFKA
jgi:toxin ParE1/3/4